MKKPNIVLNQEQILDAAISVFRDEELKKLKRTAISQKTLGRVSATLPLLVENLDGSTLLDFGFSDYWIGIYRHFGCSAFTGVTKATLSESSQVAPLDQLDLASINSDLVFADIDTDQIPVEDESFDIVCCFEILEHLATDPMQMIAEANRVLKPNGILALSTPNIASAMSLYRLIRGRNPNNWSAYSPDPVASSYRHKREYTASEVNSLFLDGGFNVETLYTANIRSAGIRQKLLIACLSPLLWATRSGAANTGTHVFAMGRKQGFVINRYPSWLYEDFTFTTD